MRIVAGMSTVTSAEFSAWPAGKFPVDRLSDSRRGREVGLAELEIDFL